MKFFTILLLATSASTSLAILNEPEDDMHLKPQPINAPAQPISEKDHVSVENLPEESLISREEPILEEDDVIASPRRQMHQRPEPLHPTPQEDRVRKAGPQSEETTELPPRAATTTEGKLARLGHKIGKNLDRTVKETMNYLKNLLPHAYKVMRP